MTTSAQSEAASVFTWPVRVYWEDTDAGGIVFYANYLKFMERARTEWLRCLGVSQSTLRETTGGMFVVTDTQLAYQHPARLDDQLLVTARVVEKTRITLTIRQEIRLLPIQDVRKQLLNSEHTLMTSSELSGFNLVCQGKIRIAWVDATHSETGLKPTRIPNNILEKLQ